MKNTRFMEVLFSAVENKDEELANQVAKDIEDAKANGSVDTDEVKYENMGDGKVSVTDKENGEVTIVEKASDESDTYDMYPADQDEQIEGYLHPGTDGVTPGQQVGAPDEKVKDHMDGKSVIAPNMPCGGLNPEAGHEKSVEVTAQEGPQPEAEEEEKEFSVSTDNSVVLRIFSDQEYCERLFSEVIESEETAKVGDLKVEKVPGEEAVVVTSQSTGDQAKVEMDGEDMNITELDSKNFSEEEQYDPLFIVGVDPINHIIVDSPVYTEEDAQELIQSLTEKGVEGCQVFEDPAEARDYAISLLEGLGVQHEDDIEEPVQAEFSDHTIYVTGFNTPDHSEFMCRCFSESLNGVRDIQDTIEDAIENGDEIETDNEIITPIDSKTAVVEDKNSDEFTKVSLEGAELELEKINENQAQELTDHIAVSEEEVDEDEEKKFSEIERYFSDVDGDIYSDETETKFFSENEELTNYMIRLYSEESDSAEIEKAIENGEQIENETEVITPIDSKTAIVEDKENGEFTKAEIDDDNVEVHPISEEEADKLTEGLAVEDNDEDEDDDDEEEEKEFSEIAERLFSDYEGEIYCDDAETKFFSENEKFTSYMERLFSGDCDCKDVEEAIENGKQVETDKEIITPIDSKSAVVEDKDNGEFTKATMTKDDIEVHPLTEEEADNLTDGLAVEGGEKKFSEDPIMNKFFSDVMGMGNAAPVTPATPVPAGSVDPNTPVIPVADPNAVPAPEAPVAADGSMAGSVPTVEAIEDKALAAVQSIRAVADEAANQIMEAKAAPAPVGKEDLKEAQFSEKMNDKNDTLVSWLSGSKFNK